MSSISGQDFSIIQSTSLTFQNGITVKIFKGVTGGFYVNTEGLSTILGLSPLSLKEKYNITKEYYETSEIVMFARQEDLDGNKLAWKSLIDQFFTPKTIEKVFNGEIKIKQERISHKQWTEEFLKDLKPLKDKTSYKLLERNIQEKLSKRFGFAKEVSTPIGRIDILGDDILCEIKSGSQWKHGLGQLCGYSQYYLTHRLYLCLFDISKSTDIEVVKQVCKEFGVTVVNDHFKLL
jgi:hypothetical protein